MIMRGVRHRKFYGNTTVGVKGQVVLPAELRRDLNIKAGDKLSVFHFKRKFHSGIVMIESKILNSTLESFFGKMLWGYGDTKEDKEDLEEK